MAEETGIVLKLIDKVSPGLATISNSNQAFNKTLQETEQRCLAYTKRIQDLVKDAAALKTAIKESTDEVNEAQKAYKKYGDEVSKNALNAAIEKQISLKTQLKDTEYAIRNTQRAFHSYTEDIRKANNMSTGDSGILGALAKAGITKMLGDTAAQAANVLVGSMFGSQVAGYFSSTLSGATAGAALGSILPGIGTLVGTAVGGAIGLINGAIQNYQSQDEAFKAYVQEAHNTVTGELLSILSSGTTIAAQREMDLISFMTLLGGRERASAFLEDIREFAEKTPFEYDTLTSLSKTLTTFGYAVEDIIPTLTKIGDAGAALGLSPADISSVATYIGRMKSSDKATLQYLNPLNERGFAVFQWIAEATGMSIEEVYDQLSRGNISGISTANLILRKFEELYGGSMQIQAETYSGLTSTLEDAQAELENAMGAGYIEKRKEGLQAEIDFLSGENGAAMQEAYSAIGAWKAELENQREQYIRDAIAEAMQSEEYITAKETGDAAKMGEIIMAAKVKGINRYNASDGAKLAIQSEISLAEAIRDDTATDDAYWNAGYKKGQMFSKGRAAGMLERMKEDIGMAFNSDATYYLGNSLYDLYGNLLSTGGSYAFGLDRVPRDGFYYLHEGERVQTASEARNGRAGLTGGITITVTGNSFSGPYGPEEVAEEIARKLVHALELVVPS